MVPPVSTLRTTWLSKSAMYSDPSGPTARPRGAARVASVAGPPSPVYVLPPAPATVVMTPPLTLRTRLFAVSET